MENGKRECASWAGPCEAARERPLSGRAHKAPERRSRPLRRLNYSLRAMSFWADVIFPSRRTYPRKARRRQPALGSMKPTHIRRDKKKYYYA